MRRIFFTLCLFLIAYAGYSQPANDDICSATVLPVANSADPCTPTIVNTGGATYTNMAFPSGSCVGAGRVDTWYKFTATGEYVYLYLTFQVVSNVELELFSATACNAALTRVYCNSYVAHEISIKIPGLTASTTYYLRLSNVFDAGIPIGICAFTGIPPAGSKVGINTNVPQNYLDVAGDASFRNNLNVAGNLNITNNLGVNQSNPQFPLTFSSTVGDKISLYGNGGNHYGFGIQSALLQIHCDAAAANIGFGYGTSGNFTERARIINSGEMGMSLTGRLLLKTGTSSAGLWLNNTANNSTPAFIGMAADNLVGLYGATGANWGLTMNTANGNVGIGLGSNSAQVPLQFNNALGLTKISLYRGTYGDVGIGVYGGELRLQNDIPNGKVSMGVIETTGSFTELAKAERNGAYAFSIFGSLWANGTTYASDERFKQNITAIKSPLQKLMQLNGVEYEMKTTAFAKNHFTPGRQMGLIAQNVEKVIPEAVSEMDGYKGVDYARLVPLLIESIKELQKEVEELKTRIK